MRMSRSKKPFEHYLAFIENMLDCELMDWQKRILRHIYNGDKIRWYPFSNLIGLEQFHEAAKILHEEMLKEDNNETN